MPGWSGHRQDLLGDELDVVEVADVEQLQVEPADSGGLTPAPDAVGDLGGRAGQAVLAQDDLGVAGSECIW